MLHRRHDQWRVIAAALRGQREVGRPGHDVASRLAPSITYDVMIPVALALKTFSLLGLALLIGLVPT